ncbi:hypothetical protein PQX77_006185 [Marasmius sp. AFHP31]|nr:hypothetical protein PQX77_006185 [Marasmius sp. AFHP31]
MSFPPKMRTPFLRWIATIVTILALFPHQAATCTPQKDTAAGATPQKIMEQVEELLWERTLPPLDLEKGNCKLLRPGGSNSSVGAEWIRLAYHDMSTHNVEDGTGGLDASIIFELDRPQNIGSGMSETLKDFSPSVKPFVAFADLIALGTVVALSACGGPTIPYRAGRIDATSAGPATVPEPHQDLASHTDAFKRQGFTQSEMIALVACGHSFGGVRNKDFPEIIQRPMDEVDLALFDGTRAFDNKVVTGYLDGTTPNPLVVGPNVTTNSDLRIFSSDGNATMQSIASPEVFRKTCGDLFGRMINTVPAGVTLTDVVEPIKYKLGLTTLSPRHHLTNGSNATIRLSTRLRVMGENPDRKITLFWKDKTETTKICPDTGCSISTPARIFPSSGSLIAQRRGITGFPSYVFEAGVNITSSVSKFWFEIDEGDGSPPDRFEPEPDAMIKQDTVVFDPIRSSMVTSADPLGPARRSIVLAVRGDPSQTNISVSILARWQPGSFDETPFPLPPVTEFPLTQVDSTQFPSVAGYTFFVAYVGRAVRWFNIVAEVGDEKIREENVMFWV